MVFKYFVLILLSEPRSVHCSVCDDPQAINQAVECIYYSGVNFKII